MTKPNYVIIKIIIYALFVMCLYNMVFIKATAYNLAMVMVSLILHAYATIVIPSPFKKQTPQ